MNEGTTNHGAGVPEWTVKEEKRGVDPLAMQTTSVALYQELLPGISNVTLRMRYYGLYAWLAKVYANKVGKTSVEVWCQYVRRAEALYALIAAHAGGERGVAGILWAAHMVAATAGRHINFYPHTDRGGEPQYLKQKFGAFGAAYGSQLVEIGLLEYVDEHEVPVPTEGVGDSIADAFGAAIGEVSENFLAAAEQGSVTKLDLERMAIMLPSRISKSSRERKLYQGLLFAKAHPQLDQANARSRSLRLILRAAQANASGIDPSYVRWTLYAQRNAQGQILCQLPTGEHHQRFAWGVYQANDLLHAAYEALLKFTLDVLSVPPAGMPMEQLIAKVSARLAQALKDWKAQTWSELLSAVDLPEDPWSEDEELSEFSLSSAIFDGCDTAGISTDDFAANAVILLAVLHKRWGGQLRRIESHLPVVGPGNFVQSIVTELTFLDEHADKPLQELLERLVKLRVVERHLWVAIQKFRGQGDYTFLLESDEGRLRVRQKAGPVFTNPRLSSAITFLTDIHLLDGDGPTGAGLRMLEAA